MMTSPSDEILLKYAAGTLDPALHLLVEQHIAMTPQTGERLAPFTAFGGLLLAAEQPCSMTAGSLDRALARIASHTPLPAPQAARWPALEDLSWRWAGPGRAIAPVFIEGSAMKAYALRIAPGKGMVQHSHTGHEWTLIVQGTFRDESGEFHTGAFIEEDEETNHTPVATGDVDCICLAVMSGPLHAPGVMGRIAQYLMR